MNAIIFCTAVAMNIFSMPAGSMVVGQTFLGERVQIQDTSLMRDWVFVGEPGFILDEHHQPTYAGVKSMGWVTYAGLACGEPTIPNNTAPHICNPDQFPNNGKCYNSLGDIPGRTRGGD